MSNTAGDSVHVHRRSVNSQGPGGPSRFFGKVTQILGGWAPTFELTPWRSSGMALPPSPPGGVMAPRPITPHALTRLLAHIVKREASPTHRRLIDVRVHTNRIFRVDAASSDSLGRAIVFELHARRPLMKAL